MLETSDWTDLLTNQFYDFFLNCLWLKLLTCFYSNKSNWNLSFYLVVTSNHNSFSNFWMLHNNFFHLSCWQSMSCSIYDIIYSWHNVKVTIFIIKSTISSIIMSFYRLKIFLDICLIIVKNWKHKWRWQRLFYKYSTSLMRLTLFTLLIYYF